MSTQGNDETSGAGSPSTRLSAIASLIWIPLSFLIPYMCVSYLPPHDGLAGHIQSVSPEAIRSGILGTIVAFLVFFLWKIDCHFRPLERSSIKEMVVICICAVTLWGGWTFSGNIMLRTHEEVALRGYFMR